MRRTSFFHDKFFLGVVGALVAAGLFLLSSASIALSQRLYGSISYVSFRQSLAVLVGLGGFFAAQYIPLPLWKRLAVPFFVVSLILLFLVFIPPLGVELQGANRWIDTGLITFQPSEIAKLSLVMFLAWWFTHIRERIATLRYGLLPFIGVLGVLAVLMIMEPDLGTFGVMALTATAMFFAAGGKITHVVLLGIAGVIAVLAVSYISPYRAARLTVFLNPDTDPQGIGYQMRQASIAIGSGGFWGLGYGASRQKYNYLPEPIGDSIFAIVAEEFGFIGAIIVIVLFVALLWRGIIIARNSSDLFSKLVVVGIVSSIVSQAFINIGAISGLLPLTGIPLPFISFGGTAMAIALSSLGIVYRIAGRQ